jgi:hypothetical protein
MSAAESSISQGQGGVRSLVIVRKVGVSICYPLRTLHKPLDSMLQERSATGSITTTAELVSDPRVAREYLRARKMIDQKGTDAKQRDDEMEKRIMFLEKKAMRRQMRCTTCGGSGHMRSSLKCPLRHLRGQVQAGIIPPQTQAQAYYPPQPQHQQKHYQPQQYQQQQYQQQPQQSQQPLGNGQPVKNVIRLPVMMKRKYEEL